MVVWQAAINQKVLRQGGLHTYYDLCNPWLIREEDLRLRLVRVFHVMNRSILTPTSDVIAGECTSFYGCELKAIQDIHLQIWQLHHCNWTGCGFLRQKKENVLELPLTFIAISIYNSSVQGSHCSLQNIIFIGISSNTNGNTIPHHQTKHSHS